MSTKHQRAKRARKGDRSFQPSSAGKGDADRTTDREAFNRNWDEIDWAGGGSWTPSLRYNGKKQNVSP